jgi:hypothetical protein
MAISIWGVSKSANCLLGNFIEFHLLDIFFILLQNRKIYDRQQLAFAIGVGGQAYFINLGCYTFKCLMIFLAAYLDI